MENYLGFIEFFVVAMFALCWGILELVGKRLDRKKEAERAEQRDRCPQANKLVISGMRRQDAVPESIRSYRGYGFRARAK